VSCQSSKTFVIGFCEKPVMQHRKRTATAINFLFMPERFRSLTLFLQRFMFCIERGFQKAARP